MSLEALLNRGLETERSPRLVATDVASWLRLEQCDRFLRFQLEYRNENRAEGGGLLDKLDVAPQPLPSLLTESGGKFEEAILARIAELYPLIIYAAERKGGPDNSRLLDLMRRVAPGDTVAVTQPRLQVELAGWNLRGDLDLLLIHRNQNHRLELTVLDMKSSADSKVEHKIQVAVYAIMLSELCGRAGVDTESINGGIVHRGANEPDTLSEDARRKYESSRAAAEAFGLTGACLDLTGDDALYQDAVDDLIIAPRAVVRDISSRGLLDTSFQFSGKCDGCFFNEACLKVASDRDDLALIPFMTIDARRALQLCGVETTAELATLKEPGTTVIAGVSRRAFVPAQGKVDVCHDLGDDRAIAGRLDEFVARARKLHRLPGAREDERNSIIGAGYGSLPYSDENHDPNLIRIYIDLQRDYLHDRVYLASALIQANVAGVASDDRRRSIVAMAPEPPASPEIERALLIDFVTRVLVAAIDVAAPDEEGEPKAPIHLIFFERGSMTALLQALGRHADEVLGATALYDFIAQQPAFDSPLVTMLTEEIRTLKNYPLLAPSLQAVARYLGFDWDAERPLTELFRSGHFDDVRPVDDESDEWFTGRARFNSAIPLEYPYAAWGLLDQGDGEGASWRSVARDDLLALARRRLEAMERIGADFHGNDRSYKNRFTLPDLALFEERSDSVGAGIEEFILTERHVELGAWRQARLPSPEQRMLNGDSLVIQYFDSDQAPGLADANQEHIRRQRRWKELRDAWAVDHPDGEKFVQTKEQREETKWSNDDVQYTFELLHPGGHERTERLLGMSEIKIGARVLLGERWSVDTRLPEEERQKFQTTARQLLYGKRAEVVAIQPSTAPGGRTRTLVKLELKGSFGNDPGFMFFARNQTFTDGEIYTVESDPNSIMLSRGRKLAQQIQDGLVNSIAERLGGEPMPVAWSAAASAGQARFLAGIDAFIEAGHQHPFEPEKRRFIGSMGDAETVLVQGPPGTGKSYTTAFAVWARIQGALAAGAPYRVVVSCKTHAATDVLIRNIAEVQHDLRRLHRMFPETFDAHFDPTFLDVPVFRFRGSTPMQGVRLLHDRGHADMNGERALAILGSQEQTIASMTPGGAWALLGETKDRFNARFSNLLVLDEASQMSLPEAMMAGISLELDGQLIVVGDHRQMPPIVQHDWMKEARRSFKRFAAYESLYLALDRSVPPEQKIKFAESFRLHKDMAEFLRREIYRHDGIPYFSRKDQTLELAPGEDAFANAVLGPEPLTIILHDEISSQTSNRFEQALIDRIAAQLGEIDPLKGLGVVVPHRAQRANLQEAIAALTERDDTGMIVRSSVDTVERFQGDERRVILVGLTQSDPYFIRQNGEFLLDPRRLTVALSRAKEKMIVVASRSVFSVIAADEETFTNAGLWKNLLRRTCTDVRWHGEIDGYGVEVRVNPPLV